MESKRPDAQPGRRPGSTPQRRPPVQTPRRYPPPRPYPPPQNAARPRPSPPPQRATQPRAYPPPNRTPQTPKPRPQSTAAAKPEPRFRDALWSATPDRNRVAFACALLYALIHIFCGVLLIYPLNLLTARAPFPLADILRAVLPALIGAALCALTRIPLKLESRVGLSAYRKLLRIVLALLAAVLLLMWGEWETLRQVARFVLLFVSAPLIAGTGLSVLLFYFDWLYDDEDA